MANSWMRTSDMKYLRVFVMRLGLMHASLRHACFYTKSIEEQIKVNDSTGNLIALY